MGGTFADLAGFDDDDDVFVDGNQASTPEASARALTALRPFSIANAILDESGLGFLGLGAQPPQPTWGTTLASAKSYMFDDPWHTAIVGVTLSATIIAFNLGGDAIRETIHPLFSGSEWGDGSQRASSLGLQLC